MINKKICELIKKEGISQRELAKQIGINESALSRYLNGSRTPRIDIISKLAKHFNISVEELLDEDQKNSDFKEIHNLVARNAANLSNKEILEIINLLSSHIKK